MTNSGMVLLPDEMLHPKLFPNELTFSFQLPTNPSVLLHLPFIPSPHCN